MDRWIILVAAIFSGVYWVKAWKSIPGSTFKRNSIGISILTLSTAGTILYFMLVNDKFAIDLLIAGCIAGGLLFVGIAGLWTSAVFDVWPIMLLGISLGYAISMYVFHDQWILIVLIITGCIGGWLGYICKL